MDRFRLKNMIVWVSLFVVGSGLAFSQGRMQNNIFAAGLNIGFIEEGIEIHGISPQLVQEYNRFRDNIAGCLDNIIGDYTAPFDPSSLKQIAHQVRAFDFNSPRMNPHHKAVYFNGVMYRIRTSLALTFGMRGQGAEGMNAEPTCDSAVLEYGYFFGRGWVSCIAGNRSRMNPAVSGLNNAIRKGVSCRERLGCAFPPLSEWKKIELNPNSSPQDFQRILPLVRQLFQNGQPMFSGPIRVPSSVVSAGVDISGSWGYLHPNGTTYFWYDVRREGNEFVGRARELSAGQIVNEGWCWPDKLDNFRVSATPVRINGINGQVYVGKKCLLGAVPVDFRIIVVDANRIFDQFVSHKTGQWSKPTPRVRMR